MDTKPSYAELERRIQRLDQAESALKQAQEALLKSEEMCRLLLESGEEGILITQEGKVRFLNPRGLAFIGYSLEEMLSQDMLAFIHPDDREWIASLYSAKLAGEDLPSGRCFRVIHKDGSIRWVQSRSTLLDWEGKPGILTFLTNVEDRKRSEEKYRILVEHAGEAIYVAQDGKLTFINNKTMEMSGYSAQELTSRSFIDFIHPDDRSMVLDRHIRRQRGEAPPLLLFFQDRSSVRRNPMDGTSRGCYRVGRETRHTQFSVRYHRAEAVRGRPAREPGEVQTGLPYESGRHLPYPGE